MEISVNLTNLEINHPCSVTYYFYVNDTFHLSIHLSILTSSYIYIYIYIYIYMCVCVCLVDRVLANGPGDRGSIPGRVISKTQKMVSDTSLFNTQHYKVRIKRKVEKSRERTSALLLHVGVEAIQKRLFVSLSSMVTNFILCICVYVCTYLSVHI